MTEHIKKEHTVVTLNLFMTRCLWNQNLSGLRDDIFDGHEFKGSKFNLKLTSGSRESTFNNYRYYIGNCTLKVGAVNLEQAQTEVLEGLERDRAWCEDEINHLTTLSLNQPWHQFGQ